MTDAKTTEAAAEEERTPPWAWMQVLPGAVADDKPQLDSLVEIATAQATQAAHASGFALIGKPEYSQDEGIMTPGHGDPDDEDYSPPMMLPKGTAESLGIEGSPTLTIRLMWETRALPKPEADDEG